MVMRWQKKAFSGVVLILLLFYLTLLAMRIQPVQAVKRIIYLRVDGEIEPSNAPILRNVNLYTFTDAYYVRSCISTLQTQIDCK